MELSLEEIKSVLLIKDNSKDDYIETIKSLIIEDLEKKYVGWTKLTVIRLIGYNMNKPGITSETLSRHSVSFSTDYPKSIMAGLRTKGRFIT